MFIDNSSPIDNIPNCLLSKCVNVSLSIRSYGCYRHRWEPDVFIDNSPVVFY